MMDKLQSFAVVFETPVAWGEMDALGHVNNIVYFQYFESARMTYLEKIGLWQYVKDHWVCVILHSTNCRFRKPIEFPDTLLIGARTKET